MIGNYLSTLLVCVFAYLYPLFLCFKVKDFSFSVFFESFFLLSPRGGRDRARETLTSSSSSQINRR